MRRGKKWTEVSSRDRNYSINLEMLAFGEGCLIWNFGVQMVSLRTDEASI